MTRETTSHSTGPAHIWIERARLTKGRLESATIALTAGPGKIDTVPLNRWIAEMDLQALAQPPQSGAVPFDQISLRVTLSGEGATLHGECANMPEGTLLTASRKPILLAPRMKRLPLSAVVRAMSQGGREFVPTTDTAQRLALWLPAVESPVAMKDETSTARPTGERLSTTPENVLRERY